MSENYQGWRFLYSRRWLGYYVMLLIFAIGCVLLANWQFDRREQAKAEIARITQNYDAPASDLSTALPDAASFDADTQKWLPFTAQGSYVGQPALVRNRPGQGGTGSHLVQAFVTVQGRVLMVDRGWVSHTVNEHGHADFSELPVAPMGELVELTGRLRASEAIVAGREPTADSAGSINVKELLAITDPAADKATLTLVSGHTSTETVSAAYAMLIAEDPAFEHGALPAKPELDEGPHLSYALQWIVFIAIAGSGIGYAARQEFKHFNRGSDAVAQMEQKAAARQQRRRLKRGATDAEEEDALLDG